MKTKKEMNKYYIKLKEERPEQYKKRLQQVREWDLAHPKEKAERQKKYINKLKEESPDKYQKRLQQIRDWKEKHPEKKAEYEKNYRSTEHYKMLRKEQNKRRRERKLLENKKNS